MYGSETKQHPMCTSDGLPVEYGGLLCCTYRCVTFATEEGCPVVPQCVPDNPWEYLVFKKFKGCQRDDPSRTQVPWDVPYVLVGTLSTQYSRNPRFILGCPHVLHIHPGSLNTKYPGNPGSSWDVPMYCTYRLCTLVPQCTTNHRQRKRTERRRKEAPHNTHVHAHVKQQPQHHRIIHVQSMYCLGGSAGKHLHGMQDVVGLGPA